MTQTQSSYDIKDMIIFMEASRQKNKDRWVQLRLCLKSPPWDRYPACHPTVLSCKQQTIALIKMHEVINTNIKRDISTVFLPLISSNSTPSPLDVSVTRAQEQKGPWTH